MDATCEDELAALDGIVKQMDEGELAALMRALAKLYEMYRRRGPRDGLVQDVLEELMTVYDRWLGGSLSPGDEAVD